MDSLKDLAGWLAAAAVALIAWLARRDVERYDDGLERISALEKASVTHEQLDRLMDRMTSERTAMHAQNREQLQRIEDKIDTNKKESGDAHKELRDELHELAIQVAKKA